MNYISSITYVSGSLKPRKPGCGNHTIHRPDIFLYLFLPPQADECSANKSLDILQYIQANIYQTDKIRAKEINQYFGISESYLGRYIKKHTNETMQHYI